MHHRNQRIAIEAIMLWTSRNRRQQLKHANQRINAIIIKANATEAIEASNWSNCCWGTNAIAIEAPLINRNRRAESKHRQNNSWIEARNRREQVQQSKRAIPANCSWRNATSKQSKRSNRTMKQSQWKKAIVKWINAIVIEAPAIEALEAIAAIPSMKTSRRLLHSKRWKQSQAQFKEKSTQI